MGQARKAQIAENVGQSAACCRIARSSNCVLAYLVAQESVYDYARRSAEVANVLKRWKFQPSVVV